MKREVCICVPVRNEAARLPVLLEALAAQVVDHPFRVSLCINNSDDGGELTAAGWAAEAANAIELDVLVRTFEPPLAHAGSARRAAMDRGAELLGRDDALLVSTDADCRPPPGWIAAILDAARDNDLIIGGRLVLDDSEAIDPGLLALHRRWEAYWTKVRAIEDAIDPASWDRPPRHGDHTGASVALSVGLYRRCGGVPLLATGEDVGLVEAALSAGGRLAHPPTVWTRASARTDGRAHGGMADEMARLKACAQAGASPMVPDFAHWRGRAAWRRAFRNETSAAHFVQAERSLPPMPCDMALPDLE